MKILLPTDFSDNAYNAFEFAKKIAKDNASTITLLFAYYSIYDFASQSTTIMSQLEESAEKAMEELKDGENNGVKVDHKIVRGSVATAVTSTAYLENYDLIIMGTQGASGIRKALVGSNTSHVIKDSRVPVLAVPYHSTYEMIKEITVSIEKSKSQKKFFDRLLKITQGWKWPYRMLIIQSPENSRGNEKAGEGKNVEDFPALVHTTITANGLLEGIKQYLKDSQNCLLVMFSTEKSFLEYLLNESNVEKMAFHTHVPLLVIK